MEKNKWIQISEEQANEMAEWVLGIPSSDYAKVWKEKGFIKASALEEARDYYNELCKTYSSQNDCYNKTNSIGDQFQFKLLKEKYEKAIEEKENKKGE